MSTKITISYGPKFHFWEECFDKSNVYLGIEGYNYEVTNNKVTVQIPIEIWRTILQDWSKKGWSKEEDNEEAEIAEHWLNSLETTLSAVMGKKDV